MEKKFVEKLEKETNGFAMTGFARRYQNLISSLYHLSGNWLIIDPEVRHLLVNVIIARGLLERQGVVMANLTDVRAASLKLNASRTLADLIAVSFLDNKLPRNDLEVQYVRTKVAKLKSTYYDVYKVATYINSITDSEGLVVGFEESVATYYRSLQNVSDLLRGFMNELILLNAKVEKKKKVR